MTSVPRAGPTLTGPSAYGRALKGSPKPAGAGDGAVWAARNVGSARTTTAAMMARMVGPGEERSPGKYAGRRSVAARWERVKAFNGDTGQATTASRVRPRGSFRVNAVNRRQPRLTRTPLTVLTSNDLADVPLTILCVDPYRRCTPWTGLTGRTTTPVSHKSPSLPW